MIDFADIVGGGAPGRALPEERTLFESQGLSVWDIATAARVFELAKERGALDMPIQGPGGRLK